MTNVSVGKKGLFDFLKKRDGLICGICKGSLEKEWKRYQLWLSVPRNKLIKRKHCDLTIDHIIPKSKIRREYGFMYERGWWYSNTGNLQLAHNSCNSLKGNK